MYLYTINKIKAAMKKINTVLAAVLILASPVFVQQLSAQRSDTEKEKEKEIQIAIEKQKKAMTDQKKAEDEMMKELQDQQIKMKRSLDEINVNVDVPDVPEPPDAGFDDNVVRIYGRRGDRSFNTGEPFMWSSGPGNTHTFVYGDNGQMTRWEFSKNVKEGTFSKEYGFDVEKTAKSVVMSVNGDCKSGEIKIKITMPNGKTYSEILIDESGNLNWRKSFSISETENQDKAGEWKYQISAAKATGYFKISLQTN